MIVYLSLRTNLWIFLTYNSSVVTIYYLCYDSMLKVLSKELTLVLSDTRELDRVPNTK